MNFPEDFELINKRIVENHGTLCRNGQLYVEEPLLGYKKVFTYGSRHDDLMHLHGVEAVKRYMDAPAVATIIIPKGSLLNLAQNLLNKFRASQAICQSIERIPGKGTASIARSGHNYNFYYRSVTDTRHVLILREQPSDQEKMKNLYALEAPLNLENLRNQYVVKPEKPFNTNIDECASGIHFFVNRYEAEQYNDF